MFTLFSPPHPPYTLFFCSCHAARHRRFEGTSNDACITTLLLLPAAAAGSVQQ